MSVFRSLAVVHFTCRRASMKSPSRASVSIRGGLNRLVRIMTGTDPTSSSGPSKICARKKERWWISKSVGQPLNELPCIDACVLSLDSDSSLGCLCIYHLSREEDTSERIVRFEIRPTKSRSDYRNGGNTRRSAHIRSCLFGELFCTSYR